MERISISCQLRRHYPELSETNSEIWNQLITWFTHMIRQIWGKYLYQTGTIYMLSGTSKLTSQTRNLYIFFNTILVKRKGGYFNFYPIKVFHNIRYRLWMRFSFMWIKYFDYFLPISTSSQLSIWIDMARQIWLKWHICRIIFDEII